MFRRHHVLVSFSVVLVTAACAAGCKDDPQATPRVIFESEIRQGGHPTKDCPKAGPEFTIGSFGNPTLGRVDPANPDSPLKEPAVPVDDGGPDQQGTVSLNCSVVPSGTGFDVAAQTTLSGATGGNFTVTGHFNMTGDSPGLQVALAKRGETFSAKDCVAKFDMPGQGIAAGRVWATVDCANATQAAAQQTCATHAQFRMENCGQ